MSDGEGRYNRFFLSSSKVRQIGDKYFEKEITLDDIFNTHDPLDEIGRKLAAKLRTNTDLQQAAELVIKLNSEWDAARTDEADGKTCSEWLYKVTRRRFRYWRNIHVALNRLGKSYGKYMSHEALIWINGKVADTSTSAVMTAVRLDARKHNNNPITLAQAHRIVFEVVGKTPHRKRKCQGCKARDAYIKALQALLRENNIDYDHIELNY